MFNPISKRIPPRMKLIEIIRMDTFFCFVTVFIFQSFFKEGLKNIFCEIYNIIIEIIYQLINVLKEAGVEMKKLLLIVIFDKI